MLKSSLIPLLVSCSAIALSDPAITQTLRVTGGFANFRDAEIFVGDRFNLSNVWDGATPTSTYIRTNQGDIPLNALFRTSVLPQLNVPAGSIPRVGTQGSVLGTLSFRGFSAFGRPTFFNNLPTELQFTINQINFNSFGRPYIQYNSAPLIIREVGTASSIGGRGTVERNTPVVLIQYQPFPNPPVDTASAPAEAYTFQSILGQSYNANFNTTLTGGSVLVPNPPGFSPTAFVPTTIPPSPGINNVLSDINEARRTTTNTISPFNTFGTTFGGINSRTQATPALPSNISRGAFTFNNVPSGRWYDPPMANRFDYTMIPSAQPVGLTSRVFPGVTGTEMSDNSLFTAIAGLPENIDQDDRFTVSVGEIVLGEFGPDDRVDFADYADILGDLLINGRGVKAFAISDINPSVDASNPLAFPVKLEFSTPTASFEMRAQGEGLEAGDSVSVLSEEAMQSKFRASRDLAQRREAILNGEPTPTVATIPGSDFAND
ncbi:hypothetical protein K4A83_15385 [Spirulina subsalsa FACHB-351]|uniref:Uncharacterized protein n=1 Tax=Spirulina subsalsa FACHB-351 TaxID=234711 RepID=A0ABT3L9K7_9CYAN|nr:hypothetical protein [Spirulina subsalsa]MCW6037645.1 hypothetical protein [Spirulina subsalsa FACHB-351]